MVLAILALATLLRLILVNQSLWLDEAIEVLAVRNNSYLSLFTQYSLGDFHPPLYHLVLKFWTGFFGFSEIGVRSLSVVFGVGTIGVVYLIGRQVGGRTLGILAALFLAVAPLHIYYSQEARMYAMAAFLVSVSVYFFLQLVKNANFFNWVSFLFLTTFFLYTDYLSWLMVIPFNLYVVWKGKNLGIFWIRKWIICWLFIIFIILPWLPFLMKQLQQGTIFAQATPIWQEVVGGFSMRALPLTAVKFIFGRISFYNKFFYGLVFLATASFFATLIFKNLFRMTKEKVFVLFWLILPVALGWVISFFIPVYSYFRFLFALPALYILLACGILLFRSAKARIILASVVLLIGLTSQFIFWVNPRFHREDWRSAVSYIEAQSRNQNVACVFVNLAQTAPFKYYSKNVQILGPHDWQDKNLNTIWLSRYVQPIFDSSDNLRKEIENQGFVKVEEKDFNGVVFWRYQKVYANLY